MKLVSVAKFARANAAIRDARPYSLTFDRILNDLLSSSNFNIDSPLVIPPKEPGKEKKHLLILISSDRGLCGGLNTNLFKKTASWLTKQKTANDLPFQIGQAHEFALPHSSYGSSRHGFVTWTSAGHPSSETGVAGK
jgi:ATP synthase F1 gamma subunit